MSKVDAASSLGLTSTLPRVASNRVLNWERKHGAVRKFGDTPQGSDTKLRSFLLQRNALKTKDQMHLRSHIRDLLAMARDMHQEVRKIQDPNTGERLQMRIGIHIGYIIGGVIGTTTLRYDMWGPDALTANELESNGVPEKILVSPAVQEVVKDMADIRCTPHGKINCTNVPMMDTYLVDFIEPVGRINDNSTKSSGKCDLLRPASSFGDLDQGKRHHDNPPREHHQIVIQLSNLR
ncbi:unnamed protein product [Peronospora farinosa]|nr:unnamed protein product [Peronospora farinosa]